MNKFKTTVFITCCLMLVSFADVFGQGYKENQIIIKFAQGTTQQEQDDFIDNILGTIVDEDAEDNLLVETPIPPYYTQDGVYIPNMVGLIGAIESAAEVDDTELNYLVTPTPLDYNEIQAYLNMPEYSPIDPACEATYPGGALLGCGVSQNTGRVRIGIIDSGFDGSHQQPIPYIKGEVDVTDPNYDGTNPAILASAGSDGVPIYSYQGVAADGHGHGTEITGIITGVCQRAGLEPEHIEVYIFKAFNEEGIGHVFDMKKAVDAAANFGLNLLNLSWSYVPDQSTNESELLRQSLLFLSKVQNVIIVTGAGNDYGQSLDTYNLAPAGLDGIDNLITVASVDCNGDLSDFSNIGDKVDICAPGEEIISPVLDGYWALDNRGTSFSTAIVTACLAQMWTAYFPSQGDTIIVPQPEQVAEIYDILLETAIYTTSLNDAGIKGGIVNFSAACGAAFKAGNTNDSEDIGRLIGQTNSNHSFQTMNNTIKFSYEVKTYPSPVEEKLNISIQNIDNTKLARVELFTLNGQKLVEKNINQYDFEHEVSINMSGLPSGMYLLKVLQNGQIWSDLIVKK